MKRKKRKHNSIKWLEREREENQEKPAKKTDSAERVMNVKNGKW